MDSVKSHIAHIQVPQRLNQDSVAQLCAEWAGLDREHTHIVVLRGGKGLYCQGLDLGWLAGCEEPVKKAMASQFAFFMQALRTAPFVTMALVEGETTGGGVGICAACDFVLATPDSRFRLTEAMLGLTPGIILPALLQRLTRQQLVKMVLTATPVEAAEALRIGLVDECSPEETIDQSLENWLNLLKTPKKQAVADFKNLLQSMPSASGVSEEPGLHLLLQRLQDPAIQERLANLAFYENME